MNLKLIALKFTTFFKRYYYLLTGLLMFLSFPTYNIFVCEGYTFFAWISLVPVFLYIRKVSFREIILSSFIAGLAGHLLVYSWIGHFGVGVGGGGGYALVLSFLIPSLTVFFTTKIVIAEFLSRRFEKLRPFIFPSVWIIVDWIQSIGFLAFPWTYWGYSQYQFTSFIQISSFTGIMGVTFVLVFANYILSDFFYKALSGNLKLKDIPLTKEFKKLAAFLLFLIIIIIFGKSVVPGPVPGKSGLRAAIIQSCISPWEDWRENRMDYLNELKYYTLMSLKENPDFIIWSESATLEHISYSYENGTPDEFEQAVLDFARDSGKYLLTGEIGLIKDPEAGRFFPQNNAALIDGEGRVVKSYSKINLVPFGEWFPYEKWLPFIKRLTISMGGSSFVPGDLPETFEFQGKKFGVLICYEGIFYKLCRQYKNLGADFLINITNDGWTRSYAGHMQHFSASVFRAIENGVWYLRAGNTGRSAFIDPYGRIIKSYPIFEKGFLAGDVDFGLNHKTFYSEYGDVFLYAVMIFILGVTISAVISSLKKR